MAAVDFRTSLRFNERQHINTITSNLNSVSLLRSNIMSLSTPSTSHQNENSQQGRLMVFPPNNSTIPQSVKVTPGRLSPGISRTNLFSGEMSKSLPNLRRLVELQKVHKQISTSYMPNQQSRQQKHGRSTYAITAQTPPINQPVMRPNQTVPVASTLVPTGNPSEKLLSLARALQKSRGSQRVAGFNDCNLETQQEMRFRENVVRHRQRSQELTSQIHDHLKAENRPTRGLFYQMIFSKRMDKSRQNVWDSHQGLIDVMATPETPGADKRRQQFETPTKVALSIAQQMDFDTRVQVGVNGRLLTSDGASSGWSSSLSNEELLPIAADRTPLSTAVAGRSSDSAALTQQAKGLFVTDTNNTKSHSSQLKRRVEIKL